MPRVSRERAAANRASITEASARLFGERGIDAVSVSDLMGAAGLTHGGFYGHFDSKDALAVEACAAAFGRSVGRWQKRVLDADDRAAARKAIVQGYLSAESRASPGTSCPTATLAGDVARAPAGAAVRKVFAGGVEELADLLAGLQETGERSSDRRQALADLSTLVGALLLARATAGEDVSDEFLSAARRHLLGAAKDPQPPAASRRLRG
jgi:TetR/AcrR family transcriptional repressor of nem operon